jgi:uncharacterized membrane protein
MRTIAGVFSSMADLERAVRDLERTGISEENISVIAGNDAGRHQEYLEKAKNASVSTGAAAASGASFGGGMGILATLVALAIPGVGPVIAGGAIAVVLGGLGVGAASGGLIGALKNMSISHEEAPLFEEAVRRGVLMLVVMVDEPEEQKVVTLMKENGARDLQDEADTWRAAGWSGLKSDPHPYVSDSSIRGHEPSE